MESSAGRWSTCLSRRLPSALRSLHACWWRAGGTRRADSWDVRLVALATPRAREKKASGSTKRRVSHQTELRKFKKGSFLDGWLLETHGHSQLFFNIKVFTLALSNENFGSQYMGCDRGQTLEAQRSCISASLPKTQANWQDVRVDLKRIENLIQSIHIDATLYTESDAHPGCKVTAMKCFLLELHVICQETNNKDIRETIENLIILANSSLSSNGNVTESGCKECEELEEKNVKEFLQSFTHIVQMFINTS